MAAKKKAAVENEIPEAAISNEPPTGVNPMQVWAEVIELSETLGIDTKMAIDLMQLTVQANQYKQTIMFAMKPDEVQKLASQILPTILEAREKAKADA